MKTSPHPIRSQPTLGDLLDLTRQLGRDAEASGSSLRHRDREIGRELVALEAHPVTQLLGWLQRVRDRVDDLRGDKVNTTHRLGLLVLAIAGALGGWGAAAVVFRYDGTHPVNVIHVMVVFVVVQLCLLVLFGLGLLPPSVTRFLPGMRTVQESLGLLSPGRAQHLLARYLPQAYRDTATSLVGKGLAHQRLYGNVDRWVVVHSSQTFAVFFNLGALASALYLVAFSDLAFSWSTTLQLATADMQRWTDLLSAPWAAVFPGARPSTELIESTRYFRLQDGSFPAAVSPVGLGGWWPFLVMCMAVYGLLPRLLTWLLARERMRGALPKTVRHLPGTGDLLARLNTELVETRADDPDLSSAAAASTDTGGAPATSVAGQVVIVAWADALADSETNRGWLAESAGVTAVSWHEAGGAHAPEHDDEVALAAAAEDGALNLVILVKAWEPPMAEFLDFVRTLRANATPQRMILVAPLDRTDGGAPVAAVVGHLDVWRQMLARLGDPWINVLHPGGEA